MPKAAQHVAVYVRVSSKAQDAASQKADLDRWIAAQGKGVEVKRYADKFTGKTMDRPGWSKLMAAARAGHVAKIVVWRLDRLGRTAKGLTALFDELPRLGVNLVSLRDGVDLDTPAGRMMANVLASVAQFETEVRAERVLAGQAAARAAGKTWGGSAKGRRLSVTDDQVKAIRRMKADGEKVAAIARATGLSRPTVYKFLDAA